MGKDKSHKSKKDDKDSKKSSDKEEKENSKKSKKSGNKHGEIEKSGKSGKSEKSDKKSKKGGGKNIKNVKKDKKKAKVAKEESPDQDSDSGEEECTPPTPKSKKGGGKKDHAKATKKAKKLVSAESDGQSESAVDEKSKKEKAIAEDETEQEDDGEDSESKADVDATASSEAEDFPPSIPKEKTRKQDQKQGCKAENGEVLEFTKPTINQTLRDKEKRKMEKKTEPLSTSEHIRTQEFEDFKDELDDLNSGIAMLRLSYGSVIRSLVAMFERREKKGGKKNKKPKEKDPDKVNFLTNLSSVDQRALAEKAEELDEEAADKYDLERFLNPVTREATFQLLFTDVESLNKKVEPWTKFYDSKGYFLREKYDRQKEMKISRKQINKFWLHTRRLAKVVDDVARSYNDDLLNYFRLH